MIGIIIGGGVLSLGTLLSAADSSTVVAHIGQTEVKAEEVQSLLSDLSPQDQATLVQNPSRLGEFVRAVLMQKLLLNEALAKKWDQEPSVVKQLKRAREDKIVDTYIISVSKVPDSYPSDAELQSAYDQTKSNLLAPQEYRLAQIFIAAPETTDPAQATLAENKVEKIQAALGNPKTNFADLATTSSEDKPTAARGGEVGWVAENQVQPELRSQITNLVKGTISPPLRLKDGWHFLKCLDIRPPRLYTLAEVRTTLIQQLRAQRAQVMAKEYVDKLMTAQGVTIDQAALTSLLQKK